MSTTQQQRQKKLERKKAKRKAKLKEVARKAQGGLAVQFARYNKAPILHSRVAETLWDDGIGYVVLSRELNNGQIAFANFMVDVWCLGVKDVHVDVVSTLVYREKLLPQLQRNFPLRDVSPAYACKLVEGAVEYAHGFGIPPHQDYRIARELFGDIDPNECEETFEYGRAGKPFFVPGPYDSPQRCVQISKLLPDQNDESDFDAALGMSVDEIVSTDVGLIEGRGSFLR